MLDIDLGNNPFLAVTEEELDKNIAEATERLKSIKDSYSYRRKNTFVLDVELSYLWSILL